MSRGSVVKAMVPFLDVVVGSNCFLKGGPVCWAPGAVNPGAGYVGGKFLE